MASITPMAGKKGRTYRVNYRDDVGKPKTKTFKMKRDATAFMHGVETAKVRGEYVAAVGGRTLFGDFAASVMENRALSQRASTQASDASIMRSRVLPHFKDRRLGQVTPLEIQKWVHRTAATHSASTTRKAFQLVANVFDAAVNANLIGRTPCRRITPEAPAG